ncbi:MAG: zinc metalloprotease HtpX [Sulfolobales archaeon]
MFLLLWNPIVLLGVFAGYILMFILASYLAPRVAGRLSGKFSLYTSMAILLVLIIIVFTLTLLGISYAVAYAVGVSTTPEGITSILASLALPLMIFVVIINLITYLISPYIINLVYRARRDERLQEIVDRVAQRLGLSKPPKAVVVSGPPNAFAYGNIVSGRHVAVTDRMLDIMSDEELEAVVGHEIGHHLHRDNMVMLFLGILPSVIYYLGVTLLNIGAYGGGGSGNRRNGSSALLLLVAGIVAVMISFLLQILVLAFSRLREYYADFEGARAAGRENMQAALAKIHLYYQRAPTAREAISSSSLKTLFIYAFTETYAEPFYRVSREDIERIMRSSYSSLEEIFATHPPIPKRLRFLEKLSWFSSRPP